MGLGGAQVWALSVIRDRPGIGMGEIAKAMDIHQSTASNLIKTLVRRELIVMTRHPADRRNAQLNVAPAGQAALTQVPGPFEGVLPQALARLSADTLQRLDRDLDELVRVLKADADMQPAPLPQL
jgi:DNA-binding MarR family transcriptional regulator